MPLTLDRYCRPVLPEEVLEVRDQDQVPGRYTNPSPEESSKQPWSGNCLKLLGELLILMKAYIKNIRHPIDSKKVSRLAAVAQLAQATKLVRNGVVFVRQAWIWKIDGAIIVHSDENASRWDFDRPSITVRGKGPISLDGGQLPFPPSEPLSRLVWILGNIVEGYDEPSVSTRWNEVFLAYSNALSFISEDVNEYAKKARIEDIDLGKEKQLFHEIGDLREELSMIKSVFAEQEKVINEFLRMLRIRTMFNKRRQRIANLEEDAERVERNVSVQLDLKQKHATIREAHSLAVLSATVFGFTVITVIFAPLSFIVALFALPIDRFNEGKYGSNKDGVYSSGYIGKWSAATELVSISVTLGAMWAALRFTGLHIWGKKGLREYIGQKVNEARAAEGGARTTDVENAQVTGSRGSWEHSRTG
ncbi:hypothetical protein F5Y10DRAFT_12021 [Nemania abortiva]|nr:hypothetical protein F5Y10DRAFT_12021 [Nemania abortiva]